MRPTREERRELLSQWLFTHAKAVVAAGAALATTFGALWGALAFGLTTPRSQIERLDARVDTVGYQVDAVRNAQRTMALVQDSLLRTQRALLAIQCIQLELPPVVRAVIPCDETWQALERTRPRPR